MRPLALLLVAFSLLGFLSVPASARGFRFRVAGHEKIVTGTVKSIDSQTLTLSVSKKNGTKTKDHQIKVNVGTFVTVDGKPGSAAAVTPGATVTVTMSHDTATHIDVKSAPSTSGSSNT